MIDRDDYPEDYYPEDDGRDNMYPFADDDDNDGDPADCSASRIVDESVQFCIYLAGHGGRHCSMGGETWSDDEDALMWAPSSGTEPCGFCGDPHGECEPGLCVVRDVRGPYPIDEEVIGHDDGGFGDDEDLPF